MSWTASTDNVAVTGYEVYRNGAGTPVATPTGTTFTDTGLTPATTYSYTVRAIDAAGNRSTHSNTATATTTAGGGGGCGGEALTFTASADAWLGRGSPDLNHGTAPRLQVDNSPVNDTLVKFEVTGTGAGTACPTITGAQLTMTVGTSSDDGADRGGDFYGTASTWNESTVTWNNAPPVSGPTVATITTPVAVNTAYTVDVTPLVTGNGPVSIRTRTTSTDNARYFSKEGNAAKAPQLRVLCGTDPAGGGSDTQAPSAPRNLAAEG